MFCQKKRSDGMSLN